MIKGTLYIQYYADPDRKTAGPIKAFRNVREDNIENVVSRRPKRMIGKVWFLTRMDGTTTYDKLPRVIKKARFKKPRKGTGVASAIGHAFGDLVGKSTTPPTILNRKARKKKRRMQRHSRRMNRTK